MFIVTDKLKINMGFISFKKAKSIKPIDFQFKNTDKMND
jgi:hypothetical protein